ncbi:hypothetical protein E2C05_29275, partial [Paracraurococcus ruber]
MPAVPLREARAMAAAALPLLAGLNLVQALASLGLPLFMLGVFDIVLAAFSVPAALWLLLAIGLVIALQSATEALRSLAQQAAGAAFARRLEGEALEAVSRLGGDPQPLRDLEALRGFAASHAAATLLDACWAPLFLAVLLVLSPAFALYGLAVAALLVLLKLAGDRASKAGLATANAEAAGIAGDYAAALRAAEAVAGLGLLPRLLARWQAREAAMFAAARPAIARAGVLAALARAVKLAATAGMIALGAWMVLSDTIGIGLMIAGTQILARMLAPIERLAGVFQDLAQARAAWDRLAEALAAPAPARDRTALPPPRGRL